jgi:phosphosulfolactate phosphohydrolase-like enzyme
MKKQDVTNALATIRAAKGDDERQHALEDALYASVLKAIANGTADDPVGLARLAITSSRIKFSRWCA